MKRQAATCRGLQRRIRELRFGQVQDPRQAGKVKLPLPTILTALVCTMVTRARSLRMVEQRTAQLAHRLGSWLGVKRRIADNTFGKVLPRLRLSDLVACLHRLVKAEHRRGNLSPTRLPKGTIAIDGKNVATVRWHDLCRVLQLEQGEATFAQVKALLAEHHPEAQLCQPEHGEPYALMRVHNVTLISSEAAVCVHQRPIEGDTNENGAMPALLSELKAAYGHSRLFEVVTTDAGNTAVAHAAKIVGYGWAYFCQIKSVHNELHAEAVQRLGHRRPSRAHGSITDSQNGQVVTYHVWRHDLTKHGWLEWTHARQLVRVQRTAYNPTTGETSKGNRYYVTSLPPDRLSPGQALALSRAHWRIEDEVHWTADAELREDRRRLAWSRHPHGVLVVSVLRMMALSILAVARRLSRVGDALETPSWAQVAEHFLLQLCDSILETEAFDIV